MSGNPHRIIVSRRTCMNLKDLKAMRIGDLTEIAKNLHVDGAAGLKKQELIFAILQAQTDQEVIVSGEGVLEVLPDGYGFLRSPDSNYLPGPDDIYVSPSQIRRFALRTGDTVTGQIPGPQGGRAVFRPPQRGENQHPGPGKPQGKEHLRQPDAALSAGEVPDGVR